MTKKIYELQVGDRFTLPFDNENERDENGNDLPIYAFKISAERIPSGNGRYQTNLKYCWGWVFYQDKCKEQCLKLKRVVEITGISKDGKKLIGKTETTRIHWPEKTIKECAYGRDKDLNWYEIHEINIYFRRDLTRNIKREYGKEKVPIEVEIV